MLRDGSLSAVKLIERCLAQIEATDTTLQAWETVVAQKALAEAERLHRLLQRGIDLGPLHGIPFGVKDNICTRGIRTTGSSRLYADFVPTEDAAVVATLKSQGAIVLGKTTTAEMALGDAPPTRNPWNVAHTPGGSSSGSAAAIAAGHVPFALATQTGGSLNRPAAYCGLVALKPTYESINVRGVLPLSKTLDHVGVMTKTAIDQVLVSRALRIVQGGKHRDGDWEQGRAQVGRLWPDVNPLAETLRGLKIGRPDRFFFDDVPVVLKEAYDKTLQLLELAFGVIVEDVILPPSFEEAVETHTVIMEWGAARRYEDAVTRRAHLLRPLLRTRLERGLATSRARYEAALNHRARYTRDMTALLRSVDLLATPTTPGPAPLGIQSTGPSVFNSPFTLIGFPTVVFPIGFTPDTGLPLSIQLIALPLQEELLLDVAVAHEAVSDWHRRKPARTSPGWL